MTDSERRDFDIIRRLEELIAEAARLRAVNDAAVASFDRYPLGGGYEVEGYDVIGAPELVDERGAERGY